MTENAMTLTLPSETNYGGFADAIGGVATLVLAIVGLAGVHSEMMVSIATIIFGVALLIQGGTMLSEYAHILFPPGATGATQEFSGGSLSAVFLAGAAGIVLGILALLGIRPVTLTAVSVIAFGSALALSSNAVWHLLILKQSTSSPRNAQQNWRSGSEILAGEMASGSAGMQALAGLAGVVLGILALVGTNPGALTLVGLLVVGATIVLTGSALSEAVLSLMRPYAQPTRSSSFRAAE